MSNETSSSAYRGAGSPAGQPRAARADGGSRLDPWLNAYAERTRGVTASEIRALFSVANRPEVVSLAGGMPYLHALPLDDFAESLKRLVIERGPVALQYGSGQGDPALRERIIDVMAPQQVQAHPDDVVVTVGSQQALDLVTQIFIDPGDVVLAEAPSYVGALGVFRSYQASVVHVPMDGGGLIPAALEQTLDRMRREHRRVKLLYTVPNHHNPAGVSLAPERRAQVAEICARYGVLILEDDPYGLLGFEGDPHPSLHSHNPDGVIYLGSFSKTFAPGYRVGWAVAPHAVRERLVLASESAILCPSAFSQLAVCTYLETQDWKHQVGVYRELYRERRDTTLTALEDLLPSASWNVPEGGFYVWVKLPGGLDSKAMLPRAVTARVAYVPGTAFFADGSGQENLRLSYCFPTPERIREGVRRLASVVDAELEMQTLFGPAGSGAADRAGRVAADGSGSSRTPAPSPDLA